MSDHELFEGLVGEREPDDHYDEDQDSAFSSLLEETSGPRGFYAGMFVEDLSHVIPYDSGIYRPFEVDLVPHGEGVERVILDAMPGDYGPPRTLKDGLRAFAERCTWDLLAGAVTIEVELFRDAEGTPLAFRLHIVPAKMLGRRRGRRIRYVPGSQSPLRHRNLHYVELDPSRLVDIALPRSHKKTLDRALHAFTATDRQQFVPTSFLTGETRVPGFRVKAHKEAVNSHVRSETRELGWDGRGAFTDGMLDPYRVWRHLQFARFQVAVRAPIMAGLQEAIHIAGQVIGFEAELEVSGLLTVQELNEAEDHLAKGTRSLTALTDLALGLKSDP
ncbi:hypothetical protein [Microbacterium enclense]|uniref:hypothetical protein n=1 Tax=Microbacterium enclense TaxID=993073 RepID=UPI003F823280